MDDFIRAALRQLADAGDVMIPGLGHLRIDEGADRKLLVPNLVTGETVEQVIAGRRRLRTRWEPALEAPDAADPEALLAPMEAISSPGYQRGMGVGFQRDPLHEELVRAGLAGGWFRAWVASVDAVPAVFWTTFAFGDRWTLYETAFAEEYADSAPGAGLLSHVIEDACTDSQVSTVGFGLGEARYKRDWASAEWMTSDVTIFGPRLRWRAVAGVQRGLSWAVSTARRAMGEDRVQALKKRLRARAAGAARRDAEHSG